MTVLSIKEIINLPASPYKGSEVTKSIVSDEIRRRYGEEELQNLDCFRSLRTFNGWLKFGFRVKKNEKAIRSYTFVERKDPNGVVLDKYKKNISLFYYLQLEPLNSEQKPC